MKSVDDAAQEFLLRPHDVIVYPDVMEDGSIVYMSTDPGLPGCISDGATPEEAAANLEDARATYVRGLLAMGRPLPERVVNSAGTAASYRSISVVLPCCVPLEQEASELQRMVFDLPVVEAALPA